ncbi:MAG: two-component sensor histidine kinase, partial [Phenylobacterium zucineum]
LQAEVLAERLQTYDSLRSNGLVGNVEDGFRLPFRMQEVAPPTAQNDLDEPERQRLQRRLQDGLEIAKVVRAPIAECEPMRPARSIGRSPRPRRPLGEVGSAQGLARWDFAGPRPTRERAWPGRPRFECRVLNLRPRQGAAYWVTLAIPTKPRGLSWASVDPLFIGVLALGGGMLALVLARMTGAPLRELSAAAAALGRDLDRPPLVERGPSEVSEAAAAFNAMQARLKLSMAERTHMLAAITHDLKTPMTRLRLRLEKVQDFALREGLLADLLQMRALVDEGLDLARSTESHEPAVQLNVDSMLQSFADDAAEAGRAVRFVSGCAADVLVPPKAFRRTLGNLVDNAIAYAGAAELHAERRGELTIIVVVDDGPGIPPGQLDFVLEPFARLETSRSRETGGSGLGLTIAKMLTEKAGGKLRIRNRATGGLRAEISYPTYSISEVSAVRTEGE